MKITVNGRVAKAIMASMPSMKHKVNYTIRQRIDEGKGDNEPVRFDVGEIADDDVKKFYDILVRNKADNKAINVVGNWISSLKNPKGTPIKSLEQLKKVLIEAISKIKPHWILKRNPDGMMVPYAVSNIEYYPSTRRNDTPYTSISLSAIRVETPSYWSDNDEAELETKSSSVSFYSEDLYKRNYASGVVDDFNDGLEDIDDDEVVPAKKASKKMVSKRENLNLVDILLKKGVMLINKQAFDDYNQDVRKFFDIREQIGKVYDGDGIGQMIEDRTGGKSDDRYYRSYSKWGDINDEDKRSRLVVDYMKAETLSDTIENKDFDAEVDVPVHPYIHTYNVSKFIYVEVHVRNLTKHVFDKNIINKLILSDQKKKMLNALVSSDNKYKDVIEGKSGGTIVLATGASGLGKTLTAEVYSEILEKALYKVQSNQLGLSIDEIESNLNTVLYRADKWNAVLLIDEADVYIHKRENNIMQNAIVGTFLRLLEYHNGTLFMTSNLLDVVDDAILSRITAHVKYSMPSAEETKKIWAVQAEQFSVKVPPKTIEQVLSTYDPMSGRDIKNTLKMIVKYNSGVKEVSFKMIEEVEEFIHFLKRKQKTPKTK